MHFSSDGPRRVRWMLVGGLLATAPAHAEDWQHEFAPYLWGSGMDGTAGVGSVEGTVDASFGDIIENLEMGFMGSYRASNGPYSIAADVIFMALGARESGPGGLLEADIDLDQVALEVTGGYDLGEQLTAFAGLRYNDLSTTVSATGPLGSVATGEVDESWVDPIIGARYTIPFSAAWSMDLRGDIGGFGVGSDFAWQAVASVRWQASPKFGVLAAYRYFDMDYEDGEGSGRFKYDMTISGPALGVVFTF